MIETIIMIFVVIYAVAIVYGLLSSLSLNWQNERTRKLLDKIRRGEN